MADSATPSSIGYFGPATTNTHAAALGMYGPNPSYQAFATIAQVFEAVTRGTVERGVVPIENSTEGIVRETLDCLIEGHALIEREHELAIRHVLMARPGLDPAQATSVVSHPQALAQCRQWLDKNYPSLPRQSATSTAAAARDAVEHGTHLAIASELAARTYGLQILSQDITDRLDNTTRFVGIGRSPSPPTGHDKTTLVFTTPHERGALRRALAVLDDAGVNMTRIESRPLPGRKWEYAFVVDVEGHRDVSPVLEAVERLPSQGRTLAVLGSYPAVPRLGGAGEPLTPHEPSGHGSNEP